MNLRSITAEGHPGREFLLYLLTIFICGIAFNLLGGLLAVPLYGLSLAGILDGSAMVATAENASFLKFYQIVNHLGTFTVPSLLYMALFMSRYDSTTMGLKRFSFFNILAGTLILFSALPFTNVLMTWNEAMDLPNALSGLESALRKMEDSAAGLTEVFFGDTSIGGLILNLFMIALIPAIGEELVFRGVLFRIFQKWVRNIHVVIFITSILFSAMHLQFYGFIPRLFLGLLFGYLFWYSRSLWVPIIIHFINNGTAVTAEWYYRRQGIDASAEQFGSSDSGLVVIVSLLLVTGLFIILRKMNKVCQ